MKSEFILKLLFSHSYLVLTCNSDVFNFTVNNCIIFHFEFSTETLKSYPFRKCSISFHNALVSINHDCMGCIYTKTFILNKEIHHPLLCFKQNILIMGGLNILQIYLKIMVLGCAGMSFKYFILMKYVHLKSVWY